MRAERIDDPAEFARIARPLLDADPVRHTVMLGVLRGIAGGRYSQRHTWAVVDEDGSALAVALRTPPFHVVVAAPREDGALALLAGRVRRDDPSAPGVNGALPEAERFAELWGPSTMRMRMRLHELSSVEPVPAAPGRMRSAGLGDEPLLLAWMDEFVAETGIQGSREQHAATVRANLEDPNGLVIWEDVGGPVAFAASRRTSPGIARVGPVYTPSASRRRGYATSLVAGLTSALLAVGATRCLLYTDLANPTSNAIYARIGYRPVLDAVEIDFIR
jgi:predicted GNAT family acetyltransferase